jgi:hypothetical protein
LLLLIHRHNCQTYSSVVVINTSNALSEKINQQKKQWEKKTMPNCDDKINGKDDDENNEFKIL